MGILQWATSPWGQQVPTHIAWVLIWVAAIGGLAFLIVHAIWVGFIAKPEVFVEPKVAPGFTAQIPAKVKKYSLTARLFHWIMAASMLASRLRTTTCVAALAALSSRMNSGQQSRKVYRFG